MSFRTQSAAIQNQKRKGEFMRGGVMHTLEWQEWDPADFTVEQLYQMQQERLVTCDPTILVERDDNDALQVVDEIQGAVGEQPKPTSRRKAKTTAKTQTEEAE